MLCYEISASSSINLRFFLVERIDVIVKEISQQFVISDELLVNMAITVQYFSTKLNDETYSELQVFRLS